MKRLLLLSLLLSLTTAFGQDKKADSLRAVLARHPQQDTFRVNRLNELVEKFPPDFNLSRCDSLANEALKLAQQLNYTVGQAHSWMILSEVASGRSEDGLLLAQQRAEKALQIAKITGNKPLLLKAYMTLVRVLGTSNQIQIVKHYKTGLQFARELNDYKSLAALETSISNWYRNQSNYPEQLQHAFATLRYSQHPSVQRINRQYALIAIADAYKYLKDYAEGLKYYQLAMRIPADPGESPSAVRFRTLQMQANLGEFYIMMGRYAEAEMNLLQVLNEREKPPLIEDYTEWLLLDAYARQGKYNRVFARAFKLAEVFRKKQNDEFVNLVYESLSRAYVYANRPDRAIYYGEIAFQYAKRVNFKEIIRDRSEILAQAYAQVHNYRKAYQYMKIFVAYRDSLNFEEARQKATVARFNEQLNQQKLRLAALSKTRQLEAQAARRQQILLYIILASLLVLAVLAYVLYRNNRQKQHANRLLNQQKQQIESTLTELRTTQAQLIQKEKLASLGELTAGIAHEIQNPLNFVNNFSEVSAELVDELKEESQAGHTEDVLAIANDLGNNLRKIHHHGGRAAAIVRGMLEHSRTDTGERRPTDLNALAGEYLNIAYHGLRAKDKNFNSKMVTEFAPDLGQVEVVPQEIGRVLLNLYNNAFYAVSERAKIEPDGYQPTVSVSTKRLTNGIEIRVWDNGTGIPEAVEAKIFQPFFTTKPTGEGTGLGLSLSYDIVTKGHGGSLTVESKEGEGTDFMITLPV